VELHAAAAAHVSTLAALVGAGTHMSALTLLHTLLWLPTGSPQLGGVNAAVVY